MAVETDPRIGTKIAGYRIEKLLGRGGMSVVYLAYDPGLDRRVALKPMSPQLSEDPGFQERFRVEWRRAASIEHPNVVPVYDAGEADGQLYIAMRYIEGADLKGLLEEGTRRTAVTPWCFGSIRKRWTSRQSTLAASQSTSPLTKTASGWP